MPKRGRPQIQIDKNIFENLCALQCALEEIAAGLGVSMDTVERWCCREYGEKFAEVSDNLRKPLPRGYCI